MKEKGLNGMKEGDRGILVVVKKRETEREDWKNIQEEKERNKSKQSDKVQGI